MADKFFHGHETGQNLYVVILNSSGQAWNGSAFEDYDHTRWSFYHVALTEKTQSGIYQADIPGLAQGQYRYFVHLRAGGSPALGDEIVGSGTVSWTGTEETDVSNLQVHGDANWATVNAATIAGAVLTNAANKLACNGTGEVAVNATNIAAIASAVATAVWAAGTRTLTSFGSLVSDIWAAAVDVGPSAATIASTVWAAATRTLTAFSFNATLESQSTAIKAVTDKLDTALVQDGGVYQFTTNALEQGPSGGDATQAKQDTILAAIAGLNDLSDVDVASAVWDETVDGSLDARNALKQMRAATVGRSLKTADDPITVQYRNADDDGVVFTHEVETDSSERAVV